jgi:hypothetical protein
MCPGREEGAQYTAARAAAHAYRLGKLRWGATISRTARCSNEPLKAHGDASARRPFSATRDASARSPFLTAARQIRSADSRPLLSAARLVPLVSLFLRRPPFGHITWHGAHGPILAHPRCRRQPEKPQKNDSLTGQPRRPDAKNRAFLEAVVSDTWDWAQGGLPG